MHDDSSVRTVRRSRLKWREQAEKAEREAKAAAPKPRPVVGLEPLPVSGPCPDLLHAEPRMSLDAEAMRPLLAFAFAGGDASEQIARVLASVRVARSEWEPDCFARHLFVDELIKTACGVTIDGRPVDIDLAHLRTLLTHPPADPAIRTFRRAVLAELAESAPARRELQVLYRKLVVVRASLMRNAPENRYEATRQRLEILGGIRAAVEQLAEVFEGTTSGLSRLRALGQEVRASEGFVRLVDLLEHERHRATVALQMQLGADGRVRSFEVQRITERVENRFHTSWPRRLFTKFSLWVRGYRFSDEELVDRWIDAVYADLEALLPGLFQLVGHVELYLSALAFRDAAHARGLQVCLPELTTSGPRTLRGLFNPLLFAQNITPVPCNLDCSGAGATTVVTGPNSGGKTRLLQALGLTQMLAETGFFVPAASATLRVVPGLFCSLVQEDAFDQTEGRLGTELLRIRRVFEKARPGALVILDELCSGTNPSEGEEIFMLVISLLRELAPETFVTTHFLGFASRLAERADELGLSFLQVELDDTDHPTYGFVEGVAHTSLAGQAAARLGVTREELLDLVRRQQRR